MNHLSLRIFLIPLATLILFACTARNATNDDENARNATQQQEAQVQRANVDPNVQTRRGGERTPPKIERIPLHPYDRYTLSGPYTHENLTFFIVHGDDTFTRKNVLTLDEALEREAVVVKETGRVSMLAVQNVSKDHFVFIQSGDIVKGGKQDRTLRYDLLLKPASDKFPLASFCVERGRWSARGEEAVGSFESAKNRLITRELRLANQLAGSQSEVWENVEVSQSKLAKNVGENVKAEKSESSLQLSLENEKVQEEIGVYVRALSNITDNADDALGYVFAVNNVINTADIYGSAFLFKKLFHKMLTAASYEALANLEASTNEELPPPVTKERVLAWFQSLTELEKGFYVDFAELAYPEGGAAFEEDILSLPNNAPQNNIVDPEARIPEPGEAMSEEEIASNKAAREKAYLAARNAFIADLAVTVIVRDGKENALFETFERVEGKQGVLVHKNAIKK